MFRSFDPDDANGLNQLTAYGTKSLTHDARGNVTAYGGESFTYSSENLLKTGPNATTLTYDPATRLYQTTSGATTSRFAYDDTDILAEYNGANSLLRRFVYDPTTGEPVVQFEGTGTAGTNRRYLSADERGSIISVSDSSAAPLGINAYDEYGIPQSGGTTNLIYGRFGYTGQAWLPEVTLYYYKARVYEPELGRFLQTDPIGYADSPNLYAYVLNDPVNWVDPTGLVEAPIEVVGQLPWPEMIGGITGSTTRFGKSAGGFDLASLFFGDVATRAVLEPTPPRPHAATCDPAGCDAGFTITGKRRRTWWNTVTPHNIWGTSVCWKACGPGLDPMQYYSPKQQFGAGAAFGGLVATSIMAPEAVVFEGASAKVAYKNQGKLWQIRFFKNKLLIRKDLNQPHTHYNIEGWWFGHHFNKHL